MKNGGIEMSGTRIRILGIFIGMIFCFMLPIMKANAAPNVPTVNPGLEELTVSDFTSGADLNLYLTDGTLVATAPNVTSSDYTFTGILPNSLYYYVTQKVGGVESSNTPFFNTTMKTPIATVGIGYVDAGNVSLGTTITLRNMSGGAVSTSPTANGDGTYRFSGLSGGDSYYIDQSINGVTSAGSNTVTIPLPVAPTVTAGFESITVSGFSSGATLKLYLTTGGATVDSEVNVTTTTYTFSNVDPNNTQYYVTQTVNGVESLNSSFVNSTLRTPTIAAGIGYIDAGNIYSGSTITLYTASGTPVSSTPIANGDGTYRFSGLSAGNSYYVVLSMNGVVSNGSSLATVLAPTPPAAPLVTPGQESIQVSNVTAGADLKLYLTTGGAPVATATGVAGTSYTFINVAPNSTQYYVTQSVSGVESTNSTFVNPTLRTPVAIAGIGYLNIGNVYPGATLTLYTAAGTSVSTTPSANGDGTYRFSGLTSGSAYYTVQSINGVISNSSNIVTVQSNAAPTAPTVTAVQEGIQVTGITPGADLKLYLSSGGAAIEVANNVTGTTYTFTNVEPNRTQYYVTQTVGGIESVNSSFVNSILRVPVATAGVGYIDVNNIYPRASITLYTYTGESVSSTPSTNGDGTYRFSGLTVGSSYYAVQNFNGVVSDGSNVVTVLGDTSSQKDYVITAGGNSTYQINKDGTLTITCSGALSELTGIYVDGKLLDPANYSLKSGSTILTLHKDYLSGLSGGAHTIKFQYGVEYAETTFTIKGTTTAQDSDSSNNATGTSGTITKVKDDVPKTGESSYGIWLCMISVLSGTAYIYLRRKSKPSR